MFRSIRVILVIILLSIMNSTTDDIDFSDDNDLTWSYIPVPDMDGYDENVTNIKINPKGIFAGTESGNPSFEVKFKVKLK